MKRGKEDEKMMGPLFPRLHVNDTEKGGPRAPPRNKMALYEQLTIPSQRYSSGGGGGDGGGTLNQNNGSSSFVPSTSSQGTSRERNTYFPLYRPTLAPVHDDIQVRNTEAVSLSNQQNQVQNNKRAVEEDDFMVPIFSQPVAELNNGKIINGANENKCSHFSSHHQNLLQEAGDGETNQSNSPHLMAKQATNDGHGANLRVSYAPSRNSADVSVTLRLNPQASFGFRGDDKTKIEFDRRKDDQSPEKRSLDRGDDSSETSMLDSASGLDVTPDDVVEIIGRKHFWKARSAIVNQQRVFAVQVFELHRLLKVQKLIAESPNLLLEGSAFVSKSSLKDSAVKKYSSEYALKTVLHKSMQKVESHKATDTVEGTAENAVPKAPPLVQSHQSPIQHAGCQTLSANTASSPPVSMDPKMNPWGFHQPAAHQWLVPVMSPSEGLVYKPYPAPGFMGPMCGEFGPVGSTPGNMMHPAFGVQTPQHQQGMGVPPGVHFGGHGYFPPYGMPIITSSVSASTVEQLNQFSGPNPYQPQGTSANLSAQRQSSLSTPSKENDANARAARSLPGKEGELHGSTASTPSHSVQGNGMTPLSGGRDVIPHFLAPQTVEIREDAPSKETQSRVIRVVPHRSARESAARIFQTIQDERRQFDSNSVL